MEMGGWVALFCIYFQMQLFKLACVNTPVFKVEHNTEKLVFWRDVSYSPKLTSLWKH
jgi:hypothetical protein